MNPYWKNNSGKLYCGDCRYVLPFIDQVDLVITSPPYGDARLYESKSTWNWRTFTSIANLLWTVLKPGGVIVWVVNDRTKKDKLGGESGESFKQALYFREIGFMLHDTMIYKKKGIRWPESVRYNQCFEYMFIFSKGSPKTFNPIIDRVNVNYSNNLKLKKRTYVSWKRDKKTGREYSDIKNVQIGKPMPYGLRTNIWKLTTDSVGGRDWNFPAAFPEKLVHDHIISWSNPGDIVLDPMSGSGTTPYISQSLKRQWIGIEISDRYCKNIVKRMTGQKLRKLKKRSLNEKYHADRKNELRRLFLKWKK